VLLDHGLYRELAPAFRRSYTRLWGALVSSNVPDIAKYCEELNVGQAYPLMASILTFKSWDDITSNDLKRYQHQNQFWQ
jgi:aarF domain-containing kinase